MNIRHIITKPLIILVAAATVAVGVSTTTGTVEAAKPDIEATTHDVAKLSAESYGVVAIHTGSWGYKEYVFGRGTTRQLAGAPAWQVGSIIGGAAGWWAVPVLVYAWTFQYRAQDALNNGQCFALVRPTLGAGLWPAKESWGCR